jgi:serine/threonine-protein kinase RsbW
VAAPAPLIVDRHEIPHLGAQGHAVELSLRIPTDLQVVEEAVDLVARHCLASGVSPRAARFVVRVVLCEALANAILYGNRLDPAKTVEVRVHLDNDTVRLHVRDEGAGFDPTTIPDPTAGDPAGADKGRGLFLIRQLVDDVRFNERGNAICMIMRRA